MRTIRWLARKCTYMLLLILFLCGCSISEKASGTTLTVSCGAVSIIPYCIEQRDVSDGTYSTQLRRGTILYVSEEDAVLNVEVSAPNVAGTVDLWPAWDWDIWNQDAQTHMKFTADAEGKAALPMRIDEAYLMRMEAAGREWLFAVDPLKDKPEIEPVYQPPELTISTGMQSVTAQRGGYSWDTASTSRNMDASPMSTRDSAEFQGSTLSISGTCSLECSLGVRPERVYATLYQYGDGVVQSFPAVEIREDGSFVLELTADQTLILELLVEVPVNHWVGRSWGGRVYYGIFIQP